MVVVAGGAGQEAVSLLGEQLLRHGLGQQVVITALNLHPGKQECLQQSCGQCFGSGSRFGSGFKGVLDPDPDPDSESGSGSRAF